jgi:hypothetical protein
VIANKLTCTVYRRCWFPANANDPSGEAWISGTVTKKTIKGDKVVLAFDLEKGEVSTFNPSSCSP